MQEATQDMPYCQLEHNSRVKAPPSQDYQQAEHIALTRALTLA